MWKRSSRSKGPVIGNPTLVETTMNEQSLQSMRGVGIAQHNNNTPELPRLPFKSLDPGLSPGAAYSQSPVARSSHQPPQDVRPPSSVYTDPRYSTVPESQFGGMYTDVSPPDSPTYGGDLSRGSPDISPIEDEEERSISNPRQETKFTSSLPVPRNRVESGTGHGGAPRPPSKNEGYTSPSDNPRTTRWDDFSGEPTTSDKGKYAQASPHTSPLQQQPPPETSSRHQFNILAKGRELNQARRRLMERRQLDPIDTSPAQRQPWKGASGRNAIVNPIRSKPDSEKKGPKFPPKLDVLPRQASPSSPRPLERTQSALKPEAGAISPQAPPKSGNSFTAPSSPANPLRANPHPNSRDHSPPPSIPYPDHLAPILNPSSNTSTQTIKPAESSAPDYTTQFQSLTLQENPSSRFSVTTYATSPPESPRQSIDANAPPVPAIPANVVASRKLPLNSAASMMSAKSTTRKPTPSQVTMATTGEAKDLAQRPPKVDGQSRVDTLQANLDALSHRRRNIGTIIHELTQVVQPSSIAYDLATRDEVKKTVTSLNNELDDIKKEEHDLGLKLLRAMKKQDEKDLCHEPSGLWVKRVTS